MNLGNWGKNVGEESRKTFYKKVESGFFDIYMSGRGLDVGGTGYLPDVHAILPTAEMVDLNYPGYDGITLPFTDSSQDFVYSSHCLEHIDNYQTTIQEWMRVTKSKGHIVIVVPHRDLYEKKLDLPSRFNGDHKRFYTAASLLQEIQDSLPVNSYRVRHLRENDEGHVYTDPPEVHGCGCYEVEVVLEKL